MKPANGALQVWCNNNLGRFRWPVASVAEAKAKVNDEADEQLQSPLVEWNAFGLEVYEDGEWVEWYDEDGSNIDDLLDEEPA